MMLQVKNGVSRQLQTVLKISHGELQGLKTQWSNDYNIPMEIISKIFKAHGLNDAGKGRNVLTFHQLATLVVKAGISLEQVKEKLAWLEFAPALDFCEWDITKPGVDGSAAMFEQ
jgi:hypothetical protein